VKDSATPEVYHTGVTRALPPLIALARYHLSREGPIAGPEGGQHASDGRPRTDDEQRHPIPRRQGHGFGSSRPDGRLTLVNGTATAATVRELVERLAPFDVLELDHRRKAMSWLASTDDVFRRAKPATPAPHLVSYLVLLDPAEGRVLLVEHRLAGLWLPPGGHVEPGEHPLETVHREAREELGLDARLLGGVGQPLFLTWTRTVGVGSHTDVSLWFLLRGSASDDLLWDRREFAGIRWWSPSEISSCPPGQFDPHLSRFLAKAHAHGAWDKCSDEQGALPDSPASRTER
jgi:8-oxo-dGTP diphosphatase